MSARWYSEAFVAGETLAAGDCCRIDADDRLWKMRAGDAFAGVVARSTVAGEVAQLLTPDRLSLALARAIAAQDAP